MAAPIPAGAKSYPRCELFLMRAPPVFARTVSARMQAPLQTINLIRDLVMQGLSDW
jgi:hypothetical protein